LQQQKRKEKKEKEKHNNTHTHTRTDLLIVFKHTINQSHKHHFSQLERNRNPFHPPTRIKKKNNNGSNNGWAIHTCQFVVVIFIIISFSKKLGWQEWI
jgi:hypothetical protein